MTKEEAITAVESILYNNCATMSEKIEQIAELITTVTHDRITPLCTNCDNHMRCFREDVTKPQQSCCDYSHTILL